MSRGRKLTLYRDDSTVQVVYDRVKAIFWTAGNTVLVISRYDADEGDGHHYVHWPRERFCWFRDQPASLYLALQGQEVEGRLCEGCPPVGYPTDETRCTPCPRRASGIAQGEQP